VQSTLEDAERFFLPLPDTVADVIAAEDASMDIEGHRGSMSADFQLISQSIYLF